ncbi:hypothetical protein [Rhodohalobacter mucosus]|uniref:hypothetical protein n=1 Tax=Rhodohalobacter mucosus TaxID=2079485 RepID=UPI001304D901|nr:hypothetical protein [Rhodohalobacter mucosus]
MDKLKETTGYSYWLLPDEYAAQNLSSLINQMALRLSSPPFIPHITLSSVPESAAYERLADILDSFSSRNRTLNVYTKDLICGDPPFQRFYISVNKPEELLEYSESMDLLLGGKYGRKENFHASIYYGFNSCSKIKDQFSKLEMGIPEKLHIQSIALAEINGLPDRWKIVHKKNLLS